MLYHIKLGSNLPEIRLHLRQLIASGKITLGGYKKGKIYGRLNCSFGKRMKMENRVFFVNEQEAIQVGYRPCSHCMKPQYRTWKATQP